MAFRQRPDGDGIDVRCKSAGCRRERIIKRLETFAGEPIWSAYGVSTDTDKSNRSETANKPDASASLDPCQTRVASATGSASSCRSSCC